ncbi:MULTISPECIES: LacI family DNA-binding transcriptional regulator [Arthrobacter]|uniref:LacI family transcriptional regulator n=1 Tax=Arthrobacter terricola TaxID=2547396 RepID=A0A4R5K9G7_9MICC|nr:MULTISPECIES: LacI family DNA-binding transcriptional regulator [Arthrobacter]MBT8162978.1 LacI family transcriptional regulator [Arthrobacter sp. GN70]TDF91811.1 LacI family transcriptional regulator [Arthrobacter terricola]
MVAMSHTPAAVRPTVTRNDVARLAGVSTAVVSYVVNNGPKKVSPATEEKVRNAIAALGYRPNAAARALKLGSSEMLGMILPVTTNPFWVVLAHAVEEAAAERGYALLIANSEASLAMERRHLENFASRRLDGVFLISVLFEPDLRDLEAAEIPAVLLNHITNSPGFDSVGVDLSGGAQIAVEHLIEHGHRKIGLVVGTNTGGQLDAREVGWRKALEKAGLPTGPVIRGPFSREGGYQAGKWLLSEADRPTAVFVSSDLMASGMLLALHESGLRIPEDLAIVSFDGSPEAEYSWPPLTTLGQPVEDMARAAVEALVGSGPKENRIFSPTLIRRASCGC